MERISKRQLFCMVVMGQIGSTNLWAFGTDAKRDAWIATLLSTAGGCLLGWIYIKLHDCFPNDNIGGIATSLLGKIVGFPLALIYVMLFIFNSTRNSSEFADLINMTFLQKTPRTVIMFLFIGSVLAILFTRIENFARITEIIFPMILFLVLSVYVLIMISGRVDFKELTPVLENGIQPVLTATYPVCINFPFGLLFMFLQIWPHFQEKKEIRRVTFTGLILSGILLTATQIINICTLGADLTANSTIPFFEVIKLINFGDIVTNLDAIGVILIFMGGFFLSILFLFSAVTVLATLFKVKDYRWFLIPIGAFIFWYAGVYEPNYPAHVKYLVPQYWQQFVPLFDLVPAFLLMIAYLKKYCGKSKANASP